MASVSELNDSFAIPGILSFDEPHPGFPRLRIFTPACTAELFLHGAHLTAWQPTGTEPVLYLSPNSAFAPGKPIRGGVPVIFPWFGPRSAAVSGNSTEGPPHGFARLTEWQLTFAAQVGDDIHLALTLPPSDESRAPGFDNFALAFEFRIGRTLTMRMTVANPGTTPLIFEQALHTYLHVSDPGAVRISGLGGVAFFDKTDGMARKIQNANPLTLTGETDRPYEHTAAAIALDDPGFHRRIVTEKSGSETTVIWNPWSELSARVADLGPDAWRNFVCVEAANALADRITLAPQSAHVMEARIRVEPLPA